MKKLYFLLFSQLFVCVLLAQVPGEINYQGVARNTSGNPLPNQQIKLRLSIRDANASGNVVYQETRQLKTNNFGLFTLAIGSTGASSVSGTIQNVNWGNGNAKFLQVEIDPKGGNSFVNMGAAQLLSVPYALYAAGAAPSGQAGGSLKGTYPNPTLAANAVTSAALEDGAVKESKLQDGSVSASKLQDGSVESSKIAAGSVTADKLATGIIPSSLPPSGTAGGDLAGNYPNPSIATGAVTTNKIADGGVTGSKIGDGSISNGKIANGAVTTNKIADGAITTSKIADGGITTAKIADGGITTAKIADGGITTAKVNNGAITNVKLADSSVSTSKLQDGSVTSEKLAPGLIVGGSSPTGSAGGDLSGNYPNPSIASQAITQSKIANGSVITPKIADGAVTTGKIADGAITSAKLAAGTMPTSLPPSGTAGGDLSGTYPNPSIGKLQGIELSNVAPSSGQVLKYNGTKWIASADSAGSFSVPYSSAVNSASSLFSITNQGTGNALQGTNSSTTASASGVTGTISSSTPGVSSSGVRGINNGTGADGNGVWGSHAGNGTGVYGTSISGSGVNGVSTNGYGTYGTSENGIGVFGTSDNGIPGFFNISNSTSFNDAIFSSNSGYGNGMVSISTYSHGVLGIANDIAGAGIFGINNAGGEAVLGRAFSDFAAGVVGRNDGLYAGLRGVSAATNGTALLAEANVDGADNGTAIVAELQGSGNGTLAVFKVNGSNVARIDQTGRGYFNNGTQVGGADVAEFFDVEGNRNEYEPGDVLVISTTSDRKVEKSSAPYSTLVSGVYATKAGLLLTEENAVDADLSHMVPMGVIGVLPTKVSTEGGAIKRGDLLVTSSTSGVAMKGDPAIVRVGQVLGKALQDYNSNGVGKINVLVSVK